MLFNSLHYIFVFFPAVTILYFLIPHRYRAWLLLLASCAFYMCFIPVYILILFTTILIDYFAGMYIEDSSGTTRKIWLWISICSTCMVLFVFKYFNFFLNNLFAVASLLHLNYPATILTIILPIGLSFTPFKA